ncbi:MAG: hypothetical protein R2825_12805 [Saprospiraceae bacterium]
MAISSNTFERLGAFDLLRWISQKYGFGLYIHQIQGYLSRQTSQEAKAIKERLIQMAEKTDSKIYVDTLVSPSYTSCIAQVIQLRGSQAQKTTSYFLSFQKTTQRIWPISWII